MYVIYSGLLALALLVGSPWFLYQGLRRRKYFGSLRQRLGALPVSFNLDAEPSIWVHAVSVGEVLAARPLVDELRTRYPGFRLFVSTTTVAGQQLARRQLPQADAVFYFPIDFAWVVRRVLDRVKPRLLVLIEGGDLAPRPARVPAARRPHGHRQRARLGPVVSAVPPAGAADAPRAGRRRRVLHAKRRGRPPHHPDGRRPGTRHGHRQPEVRRRARAGAVGARPASRPRAALLPPRRQPSGRRRRQHHARAKSGPCCRRSAASRPRSPRRC